MGAPGRACVVTGGPDAALETALLNLIQPGEAVVVAVNGPAGEEVAHRAARAGADVISVTHGFGDPIDPAKVEAALWARGARLFAMAHADLATGAVNDPAPLCTLAHAHATPALVDCAASLGSLPIDAEGWGADVVCGGGAQALGAPAGVSALWLAAAARTIVEARRTPPFTWSLDLARTGAASDLPYALLSALQAAAKADPVGDPRTQAARLQGLRRGLAAGLAILGLPSPSFATSPGLVVALAPSGVDADQARRRMRDAFGVQVGGFVAPDGATGWRIGLARAGAATLRVALTALADALGAQGLACDPVAALRAADRAFGDA